MFTSYDNDSDGTPCSEENFETLERAVAAYVPPDELHRVFVLRMNGYDIGAIVNSDDESSRRLILRDDIRIDAMVDDE